MNFRNLLVAGALAASLSGTACASADVGSEMSQHTNIDSTWSEVVEAETAEVQRERIDAFLELNRQAGSHGLMVSAARRADGTKAAIDKALWDNPQDYELTLRYGDRVYRFVPLSRASLEPLFRE